MSDLIAIAYKDLPTAQEVTANLAEAQKAHLIQLDDLVIVERKDDKIKLHQPSLAGAGALGGAAWGGLIGLIFLVPFFGMAVGAATGAMAGALSDAGIDDKFLKELGDKLEPGGAAVIGLVRSINQEKILEGVKIPGELIQTSLTSEAEGPIRDALARAGAGAAS
ncbi:DUF1269 domain-containing protein [Conexibacter woesei]|uniref:DUF1269 domain-containing protein n=1 Tax=Conexibacter woesei TaxID=191495 RepID=UPI0003F56304|nr:DUF1269 domain-containing protein [Conexibacter woesei]